jgi:hypothetical protein
MDIDALIATAAALLGAVVGAGGSLLGTRVAALSAARSADEDRAEARKARLHEFRRTVYFELVAFVRGMDEGQTAELGQAAMATRFGELCSDARLVGGPLAVRSAVDDLLHSVVMLIKDPNFFEPSQRLGAIAHRGPSIQLALEAFETAVRAELDIE